MASDISVIIPVFNVQEHLEQAISCVLDKQEADLELILVDDGSSDLSPEICEDFARRNQNVIVIHQDNRGPGAARNAGLDVARGEFVFFLDSDDQIRPCALDEMLALARCNHADLVCSDFQPLDKNGEATDDRTPPEVLTVDRKQLLTKYFCCEISTTVWAKLYRRDLWDGLRFPDIPIHEDAWILHLVLARCESACFTNKRHYLYRLRDNSCMRRSFSEANLLCIACGERYVEFAKKNFPALEGYARIQLLSRQLYTLDKMKNDGALQSFKTEYLEILDAVRRELPLLKSVNSRNKRDLLRHANELLHPYRSALIHLPLRGIRRLASATLKRH